MDFNIT